MPDNLVPLSSYAAAINRRWLFGGVPLSIGVFAAAFWALPDPRAVDLANSLLPPFSTPSHPLGTDLLGADVAAQFIWGGLLTIAVALPARLVVTTLAIGLAGAHFVFPRLRALLASVGAAFVALPSVFLALFFASFWGGSPLGILAALVLAEWAPAYISLQTRVTDVAARDFITGARILGNDEGAVFVRHILPVCRDYLAEILVGGLGGTILTLAILSFLGFGIRDLAGLRDWGGQLAQARVYLLEHPLLTLWPASGIFFTVSVCNLLRAKWESMK